MTDRDFIIWLDGFFDGFMPYVDENGEPEVMAWFPVTKIQNRIKNYLNKNNANFYGKTVDFNCRTIKTSDPNFAKELDEIYPENAPHLI